MIFFKSGSYQRSNRSIRDPHISPLSSASSNSTTLSARPSVIGASNPPTFSDRAQLTGISRCALDSERATHYPTSTSSGQYSTTPQYNVLSERELNAVNSRSTRSPSRPPLFPLPRFIAPTDRSSLSRTSKSTLSDASNSANKGSSSSSGISCSRSNKSNKKTKNWILELEGEDSDETNWEIPCKQALGSTDNTKAFSCSHVQQLQKELDMTQNAFLTLSTQYTRMQFKLRQVIEADPLDRDRLLDELKGLAYGSDEDSEYPFAIHPELTRQKAHMHDLHHRQSHIIDQLRSQLDKLQLLTCDDNSNMNTKPNAMNKNMAEVIPMYEYYYVPRTAKNKTAQNQWSEESEDAIKPRKFVTNMFQKLDNYP